MTIRVITARVELGDVGPVSVTLYFVVRLFEHIECDEFLIFAVITLIISLFLSKREQLCMVKV